MEQNFNKEIDFKEKLLTFFKEKKTKILISFFLIGYNLTTIASLYRHSQICLT